MRLENQTALITGSSGGIGEEFARQLALRGANLILVARRADKLDQLRTELLERSPALKIDVVTADLSIPGSAADLALLLVDHHGASLIVTVGHSAGIEEFFDRSRAQSNPSTFLTRLKVGEKLVDAKAVATLYRSHISGGAIALLVLAVLFAIVAALWVSHADTVVIDWLSEYWNRISLWVQSWVT